MSLFTPEALRHFATHHGIATFDTLIESGMSRHVIDRLQRAGNLLAVLPGTYRLPAVPFDEPARCVAMCAAHPEVAIAGPTAGRLWGFRRIPRDLRVHVLAPPHSHPTNAAWVAAYRTAAVHPEDVEARPDGIVLTSRARTALDLARYVGREDLSSIVEQAIADGGLTVDDLRRTAVDWISPRRPWLRVFLELLDRRLPGGPAESHGEVVLGDALRAAGVRGLVRQFQIDLPGYGPARFDLAVPAAAWAIEIDLFPTHREPVGRRNDRWRDEAAARIGWTVSRVSPDDFGAALDATVHRLRALYDARRTATA